MCLHANVVYFVELDNMFIAIDADRHVGSVSDVIVRASVPYAIEIDGTPIGTGQIAVVIEIAIHNKVGTGFQRFPVAAVDRDTAFAQVSEITTYYSIVDWVFGRISDIVR